MLHPCRDVQLGVSTEEGSVGQGESVSLHKRVR